MKITKYASQTCIKCKLLDRILKHMNLLDVETIMMEDVGIDYLVDKGISSFPTLVFEKDGIEKRLYGNILPQDITDILQELNP